MPFVEINVKNEIEKQRHNNPKRKKKYRNPFDYGTFKCFI